MSDFVLLSNRFREVVALFPDQAEHADVWFRDYLIRLAQQHPVRIITTETQTSRSFLATPELRACERVEARCAAAEYHEKGILAPNFYIEGSMNITYSGVYVRGEKITYHVASDAQGKEKISRAYLEFERRWSILA